MEFHLLLRCLQIELQEEEEQQTGEIITTTNQVF
jgi:hypothetical protein